VLEESLPIWYGGGGNGKTTTARVLMEGLGDYARKAAAGLLVASKYERHPTEIADLAGTRLAVSEETDDGRKLDEARVKDLCGGGILKARFMRGDFFEFAQTFSTILLTNHKPVISGVDDGIWRRVRLIPWSEKISDAEKRPQDEVVAELLADGSAVLDWLVAGLADWQEDHTWVADEVRVATLAYRSEQDRLSAFFAEVIEVEPFATVAATELTAAYTNWGIANGETTLGKNDFANALKERGFTQKKGQRGIRLWVGLRLQVATGGDLSVSPNETQHPAVYPHPPPPGATLAQNDAENEVSAGDVVMPTKAGTDAASPSATVLRL
jgi:putative DNA primase/helicase